MPETIRYKYAVSVSGDDAGIQSSPEPAPLAPTPKGKVEGKEAGQRIVALPDRPEQSKAFLQRIVMQERAVLKTDKSEPLARKR